MKRTIYVEHGSSKKEFANIDLAIIHAEALTKLGYPAKVYTLEEGLYSTITTILFDSTNENNIFSAFYNFKARESK